MLADEQRTVLLEALDRLRENDRLAIAYRYFFDLSEAEMMVALGWRQGTVKSRLNRALARFRSELGALAVVPPGAGGTLAPVARQLAGAAEAELEHGLQAVGAHLAQLPTSDLSAAVIQRVHAGNANPSGHGNALSSSTAVGGTVAIAVVLVVLILGHQPPTSAQPPPTPVAAAPSAASPTPTAVRQVTVLGADLDPAGRAEVQQLLDVQPETQVQTLDRGDVLSTLTAAGLSANPSDPVLSSVSLHCPGQTPGLQVHMTHITGLAPLTFATALLVVAAPDASVDIAAPAAQPVSGESAVVGMLQAIGDCSGQDARSAARVSLGYALIRAHGTIDGAVGRPSRCRDGAERRRAGDRHSACD